MNKSIALVVICALCAGLDSSSALARGYGGARGGGGSRGGREGGYNGSRQESYSGNHYSGSRQVSDNDGQRSVSREGSYSGNRYSGSHEGSAGGGNGFSGSREGSYGGNRYSGSHEGSASGGRGEGGSFDRSAEGSTAGGRSFSGDREGSYGGGSVSGSREGSVSGNSFNASREGSFSGTREGGGYGAAGYGERSGAAYGERGGAYGYHGAAGFAAGEHTALPTDGGFAAAGAAAVGTRGVGVGAAGMHSTWGMSNGMVAARGDAVRTGYNNPGLFNAGWYGSHAGAWSVAGWPASRVWSAATWPAMGAWYGWNSAVQPISYNYGTNVVYQGDQVYNNGEPVASAADYYQQAATLAQSPPAVEEQDQDWMPLGTFGLVKKEDSDPHYIMQLAVHKSGAVAGNYYDTGTDTNTPIHGAVDQKTQKLAWTVGDKKNVVGEVGLYNLTKPEAPALIHIGPDRTQQWLLVRLNPPQQPAGQ